MKQAKLLDRVRNKPRRTKRCQVRHRHLFNFLFSQLTVMSRQPLVGVCYLNVQEIGSVCTADFTKLKESTIGNVVVVDRNVQR